MEFSLQIVKKALIENGEKENMMSSPLSIATLLNILPFRLTGSDQQHILQVLGSKTPDDLKSNYTKLAAASSGFSETSQGEDPVLNFINGAWANQKYGFERSFEDVLKSVFKAETKVLDFEGKKDESVKEINSWVEKNTNGLICGIVNKDSVNEYTRMVLANALYFKGKWENKFKLDESDRHFYTNEGQELLAPFMRGYGYYKYKSFDTFKVASIPYKSRHDVVSDYDDVGFPIFLSPRKQKDAPASGEDARKFSMNVFLPKEYDGLPALLKKFSANTSLFLSESLSALSLQEFEDFLVPKFNFSYDFELTEFMKELGLDIGGVNVFQKTRIIVDEEGTEAAAVTYELEVCADEEDSYSPPKLPRFVADHPFMFVIREDTTGMPFFVGVVVNPLLTDQ